MRASSRSLLAALAAASLSCGGDGDPSGPVDRDGDGWFAADDCDDRNGSVWSEQQAYVDGDHDSMGAGALVTVCAGWSLPSGHASMTGDCDDADGAAWSEALLYEDADGDGIGAGSQQVRCIGADSEPPGWAAMSGDCAPEDALAWRDLPYLYRDADGDGATVSSVGMACAGLALPAG
jgi:hypothetical protein